MGFLVIGRLVGWLVGRNRKKFSWAQQRREGYDVFSYYIFFLKKIWWCTGLREKAPPLLSPGPARGGGGVCCGGQLVLGGAGWCLEGRVLLG